MRIVLDRSLRTPSGAQVLDGGVPTLVMHAPDAKAQDGHFSRVELVPVAVDADGRLDLPAILRTLAERGVNELQVEAGSTLCGALFARALADEILLYVAPVILGDQALPLLNLPGIEAMSAARRLRIVEQRQVGADLRLLLRG